MGSLIYINLVPADEQKAFETKVNWVAAALNINPNWIMQLEKSESGIRADIENRSYPMSNGYATGLIQFTPDTAISLGTTVAALKQMSRVEQMDYVYKYLLPYKGKIKSYFDLYLVTFFPAAISHSNDDSYVFETSNIARSSVARNNPTMDINHNGEITMGEFKQYVKNTVNSENWPFVFGAFGIPQVLIQKIEANPAVAIFVFTLIAAATTYIILRIKAGK